MVMTLARRLVTPCIGELRGPVMRFVHHTLTGAAALLTMFVAGTAAAAPCDDLTGDGQTNVPILWVENGDTQEPLLKRLGKQLMQTAGTKVRIIYRNRPTCELANNFYTTRNLAVVAARPIRYIPEDPAFDPATTSSPVCDQPAVDPPVMLGIGATFLSSCPTLPAKPATISVVDGPNQAYGFVVNKASSQVAITAEEGYLAWGFTGNTGNATPWIDQSLRFTRAATASTTLTTSSNIGLTAAQMLVGAQTPAATTSLIVLNNVAAATDVQAAIGALGGDLYDQNRPLVKMLAFRAFNQRYAYFPDASATSFDKQNVRDGHYLPWSPTPYLYVQVGVTGQPLDPIVARAVSLIFGKTVEADVNGLRAAAQSGLIPQCAMKVRRAFDGGDLSLYSPPEPCGCFFEKTVPQGTTACTGCVNDSPCGTGKCRFGYCEAK
jgi:hypothetical protein